MKSLDFDLELTGFQEEELAQILEPAGLEGLTDPDSVPELPSNPVTVPGDLWILGKHRLMCGDSRDFSAAKIALGGRKANICVTSPPYASQRKYDESTDFKPIHPDKYVDWFAAVAANIAENLAEDGSYFLNIKEHCEDGQRHLYVKDLTIAHVRTTRDLVEGLRRAEFDEEFVSPGIAAASRRAPYHLFWDDIDKLKLTDFKTEVLFDLVDSQYRQKHGLTVTGDYSMRDLVERERMHPAIVRRLDDMCRVVEV